MKVAERRELAENRRYQLLEDMCDRGFPQTQKELTPEQAQEAARIRPQLAEDIYSSIAGGYYRGKYRRRKPIRSEMD